MLLITFYIQKALNKLTHYRAVGWGSRSAIGLLQQPSCSSVGNSAIVLRMARCSWLLQAAKMLATLMM